MVRIHCLVAKGDGHHLCNRIISGLNWVLNGIHWGIFERKVLQTCPNHQVKEWQMSWPWILAKFFWWLLLILSRSSHPCWKGEENTWTDLQNMYLRLSYWHPDHSILSYRMVIPHNSQLQKFCSFSSINSITYTPLSILSYWMTWFWHQLVLIYLKSSL